MKMLDVVAGILVDAERGVLISERNEEGPFQGLWEFPGGKIGAGETPVAALRRELEEEIGITISDAEDFMSLSHTYPDRHVDLRFFRITDWTGEPQGLEGQRLRWVQPGDIDASYMLPADTPVIDALRS